MNKTLVFMNLGIDSDLEVREEENTITIDLGDNQVSMNREQAQILFGKLDISLHDQDETNAYLQERVEILENMVIDLEEEQEEIAGLPFSEHDGEYDFYEKVI